MSWNPDEAQQIGRMEEKLDTIGKSLDKHGPRLSILESHMNRVKGVLAFLSVFAAVGALLFFTGCAHQTIKTYYPSGEKQCRFATTVIGQGTLGVLIESDECPDTIYESEGTGLSDNAVIAIEKGIEAAVKAAVKSALPIPEL